MYVGATLVTMLAGRGLAKVITGGQNTSASNDTFRWIANGYVLGLPKNTVLERRAREYVTRDDPVAPDLEWIDEIVGVVRTRDLPAVCREADVLIAEGEDINYQGASGTVDHEVFETFWGEVKPILERALAEGLDDAIRIDAPVSPITLPGFAEGEVSVQDAAAQRVAMASDAWGYLVSDEPATCAFTPIDVSGSPPLLPVAADGASSAADDGHAFVLLAEPFELYGTSTLQFAMSTNGVSTGTPTAATSVAAWLGARVFRAHDVRATRRTLRPRGQPCHPDEPVRQRAGRRNPRRCPAPFHQACASGPRAPCGSCGEIRPQDCPQPARPGGVGRRVDDREQITADAVRRGLHQRDRGAIALDRAAMEHQAVAGIVVDAPAERVAGGVEAFAPP